MMERKTAETWIMTTLLLMNFASMVNSSTRRTSETFHALNPLSTSSTPPPMEWNQTYGGPSDDVAHSVVQTSDGGYALAGSTNSSGTGSYDFWLVKTDQNGTMEWNQTYGGLGYDVAYSVVQTSDGGYALAGCTNSSDTVGYTGGYDFWLVKTNSTGGEQWNQTYGGPDDDGASSVVQTSDGGYALAGSTNSFGSGSYDFWLVKTYPNDTKQWDKTYGGADDDGASSVVQTSDGGYALAGSTNSYGAGGDFWLVKANSIGVAQWSYNYGGISSDWASSVVQTSDGGYALAGCTLSYGAGGDFWLVKANSIGVAQWSYNYGGINTDWASSVVQTSDGGYALAGYTLSYGAGGDDFWLVKAYPNGTMQWNQTYGGSGNELANSVVQTSDGGYALAGSTNSLWSDGYDFYLVKARSCTLTITTTTGGTTSPPAGAYLYSVGTVVTVSALPNANYAFDHWILDGAPNGTANQTNVTMNADYSLQAVFTRTYALNITVTAGGTTNPTPGTYIYFQGTLVNVTASPDTGYYLDHWELDGAYVGGSNPIQVSMNTDHQLKAVFVLLRYTLVITATAGGTTNPTSGMHIYNYGTIVNVTASPDAEYYLDRWELDGSNVGGANPIQIAMNNDHTLHAVFEYGPSPSYYTLNITVTLGGTTNPSPGTYIYSDGTLVNVSALPNANYAFDHWSLDGAPVGAANPISVMMNVNHSLQAVFTRTYALNITVTAGGTTNPTPGTYIYFQGTLVNVTASPDTGYYLDHWELDGSNVGAPNPIQVPMNNDLTLHAIFLAHDVAVINLTSSKTVVFRGYCDNLTVTAENLGNFTENFNVTVYANTTTITTLNFNLPSGSNATQPVLWNTTGFAYGNYTLSAIADTVPGETNTTNNSFTDGNVRMSIVGDLTGRTPDPYDFIPDGKVNIVDVSIVAKSFGQKVPPAPANCDVSGPTPGVPDGKIDISDVALVAKHFGEHE